MRNLKLEQNLVGHENWPHLPIVEVPAHPEAKPLPDSLSVEEKEAIIQSWSRVAVFEVSPSIAFRVGFWMPQLCQFLKAPIEATKGQFGMRVGPGATSFFVIPEDLASEMTLKLVEVTDEDDPKYPDLPIY